jgi:hypothetical protein
MTTALLLLTTIISYWLGRLYAAEERERDYDGAYRAGLAVGLSAADDRVDDAWYAGYDCGWNDATGASAPRAEWLQRIAGNNVG